MSKKENKKVDFLSINRTNLANERTLLAYWRTSLAFFVLWGFLIKTIYWTFSLFFGIISIIFWISLFIYWTTRYLQDKKTIKKNWNIL